MSTNSCDEQKERVTNLKALLEQSVRLFGNKNAFHLKIDDETYKDITYTDFKNDIDALGTVLINMGLKNKFIAVIGENRYEWCLSYLAVANGTGVTVPLDRELPVAEIENLLQRSEASAIIFSGKLADKIKEIKDNLDFVKYFINMDLEQDEEGFLSFWSLVEKGRSLVASGDRSFIDAVINDDVLSVLVFTSGTTDLAKGVMLSHRNITSNVCFVSEAIKMNSNDSILSILPLHHTYECTAGFLTMLYNGCCISFNEGLKYIAKNLKEIRPTLMISVPLILENMYKKIWDQAAKSKITKFKLKFAIILSNILYTVFKIDIRRILFKQIHESIGGRLRIVISGAAAIKPEVVKGFNSMGIRVLQGYGLTECSPIVTVTRFDKIKYSSIGQPLPGIEVKIDNPNEDGIGELLVKGDSVMLGYYKDILATKRVLKYGWLHTGDLGYMDKSGFLYITGRKKNVIVTKNGKNIFPEEVEAYLNKSPYVLESIVFGKDDEKTGETLVIAKIVPDYETIRQVFKVDDMPDDKVFELISNEVKKTNRSMPLYKRINSFEIRKDEFAKTTTKKIKRYMEKIS